MADQTNAARADDLTFEWLKNASEVMAKTTDIKALRQRITAALDEAESRGREAEAVTKKIQLTHAFSAGAEWRQKRPYDIHSIPAGAAFARKLVDGTSAEPAT